LAHSRSLFEPCDLRFPFPESYFYDPDTVTHARNRGQRSKVRVKTSGRTRPNVLPFLANAAGKHCPARYEDSLLVSVCLLSVCCCLIYDDRRSLCLQCAPRQRHRSRRCQPASVTATHTAGKNRFLKNFFLVLGFNFTFCNSLF